MSTPITDERLREVLDAYGFSGILLECRPFGSGHIHDTFALRYRRVDGSEKRYLLQHVNTHVFRDPEGLMDNMLHITNYLQRVIVMDGGDPARETLNLLTTKKGGYYYVDSTGLYWRAFRFIEDSFCYEIAETPEQLKEAARVFGRFQRLLADYPAETLRETIPNFHYTPARLARFKEVLAKDPLGRAKEAKKEIRFILDREKDCFVLTDLLEKGELPLRVTHNDTKLNNALMDRRTGKGLCAIDLDTVMPGLSQYDFGDAIRTGSNPAPEDEQDLRKVVFNKANYRAFLEGFLEEAGEIFTEKEIEMMPWGAKIITFENGIRFLTDFLEGDVYFKTSRPGQNLDRCRTQEKLVADMEACWNELAAR